MKQNKLHTNSIVKTTILVMAMFMILMLSTTIVSADTIFSDNFEGTMAQWDPSSPTNDVYLSDTLSSGD